MSPSRRKSSPSPLASLLGTLARLFILPTVRTVRRHPKPAIALACALIAASLALALAATLRTAPTPTAEDRPPPGEEPPDQVIPDPLQSQPLPPPPRDLPPSPIQNPQLEQALLSLSACLATSTFCDQARPASTTASQAPIEEDFLPDYYIADKRLHLRGEDCPHEARNLVLDTSVDVYPGKIINACEFQKTGDPMLLSALYLLPAEKLPTCSAHFTTPGANTPVRSERVVQVGHPDTYFLWLSDAVGAYQKLFNSNGIPASQIHCFYSYAYSKEHLQYDLRFSTSGSATIDPVKIAFGVDYSGQAARSSARGSLLVILRQVSFTVALNNLPSPDQILDPQKLQNLRPPEHYPAIVDSVTYGRIILLGLRAEHDTYKFSQKIQGSLSGDVLDLARVRQDLNHNSELQRAAGNIQFSYFCYGTSVTSTPFNQTQEQVHSDQGLNKLADALSFFENDFFKAPFSSAAYGNVIEFTVRDLRTGKRIAVPLTPEFTYFNRLWERPYRITLAWLHASISDSCEDKLFRGRRGEFCVEWEVTGGSPSRGRWQRSFRRGEHPNLTDRDSCLVPGLGVPVTFRVYEDDGTDRDCEGETTLQLDPQSLAQAASKSKQSACEECSVVAGPNKHHFSVCVDLR